MDFALIEQASWPVRVHLACALAAIVIGAVQLARPKGTPGHRVLGIFWIALMLVISVSSFWIHEVMPTGATLGFSPIHLLSIWVIYQMASGYRHARAGQIDRHRKAMTYTYIGGLIIAGLFTFTPGRLLYRVILG